MTLSPALRKAVCEKYDISERQLRNKVVARAIEANIADRDVALLLLAHERGIDIYRPKFNVSRDKQEKLERYLAAAPRRAMDQLLGEQRPVVSAVRERQAKTSMVVRKAERAYAPGEQYDLWKDLRGILRRAKTEVFVVEPHPSEEIFDLYLDSVPKTVSIRILFNKPHGNFIPVAKKFSQKYAAQVKSSQDVHDRHVFVDNRAWVIGSSVKDAATKKPTYMIELSSKEPFYGMYGSIFANATSIT